MNGKNDSLADSSTLDTIKLDKIDKKILENLQKDGTLSLRALALKASSSFTAVKTRLDRLKDNKVILDTIAVIDCCKIGYHEMLILSIRLNNRSSSSEVISNLENIDGINCIYQVSGVYPLLCIAKCISKDAQIDLLESVKAINGIEEVTTQVVLRKIKEDMRVRIP
ncbi:MAG: Lrp/AsnC family transcriptional regulator [Candidatus Hodarchaeales archaeon]